jgi:glycogen synthase
MKLLVYSHYFAPSIGGVETIVLSLARGLANRKSANGNKEYDLTLATQTPAGEFDDGTLEFPVVRRPKLATLWRLIRSADLVHIAGPALLPLFLRWLCGKPVVLEHHVYQSVCPNGILLHLPDRSICPGHFQAGHYGKCWRCQNCEMPFWRSAGRLLLMFPRFWLSKRAARNIAVSRRAGEITALPRSIVVCHGVDDPLRNSGFVATPRNASAKVCFAFVGRFVPEKGIVTLLQAAHILRMQGREFELRLIGDGPERPKLETIIREKGLESCVHITGFLKGNALAEVLSDVGVVVMPSVWQETAGLAAIEQMIRGRLVIVANVGGLSEIVGDTGLTFPPSDVPALVNCMKAVLQDKSMMDTYGRKARERALEFFLRERMIDEHATVYREVRNRAKA